MASTMSINTINNTVSSALQTQQAQLTNTLTNLETRGTESLTPLDLLKIQQQMGQMTMFVELQSTMVKAYMDAVKSVIQKSS